MPVLDREEKFLFNLHIFDADAPAPDDAEQETEPPPVVYSEAELEAAKAKAFAEGHKKGVEEETASRTRYLAGVMAEIARETTALFAQEHLREKLYEREAVDLAMKIFEKLFPAFTESYGFEELKAFIAAVLEQHGGRKKISVHVEPDLADGVEKFMEPLSLRYAGLRFAVVPDEGLAPGSCKVRWEDGGAVRDSRAIAVEIHHLLQDALAAGDTKGHDDREAPAQEAKGGTEDRSMTEDTP